MKKILIYMIVAIFMHSTLLAELRVGVSAPFTGPLAEYGLAVKQGIELAIKESPEKFKNISFIYEDNKYEAKAGITTYKKLKEIDKVDIIFSWGETPLAAIAPLAERHKFPIVAMSFDPEASKNSKYIIRSINHSEDVTSFLLEYMRKNDEYDTSKIGIVSVDDPYQNSLVKGLENSLKEGESVEVVANLLPEDNNFKSLVSKLKYKKFSTLGIYLFPGQISHFYKVAESQGYKFKSFGSDIFDSSTEIKKSSGSMNGSIFPIIAVPDSFYEKYTNTYNNNVHIAFAYNTYVFTQMLEIISFERNNKKITASDLINFLKTAPSKLNKKIEFKNTKSGGMYFSFPLVIKKIIDGEITILRNKK